MNRQSANRHQEPRRKASAAAARRPVPLHALTVDVEDYFQVEAFRKQIREESWDGYPLRVEGNTLRLLDLFDEHGVKATFFVLGWIARKAPRLVEEIARRGHEVGCHSYWHRMVYTLTPQEFRADTRQATAVLQDAAQRPIQGYRAPKYSITPRTQWALEILAEEGYAYDSSIFPDRGGLHGFPGFPRFAVKVSFNPDDNGRPSVRSGASNGRGIIEFPPATVDLFGKSLPGPGGGYLRILPLRYALWALRRSAKNDSLPTSVYVHPWEVDPGQPRVKVPWLSRLRHYTGLKTTARKLEALLKEFRFASMGKVLEEFPPQNYWISK